MPTLALLVAAAGFTLPQGQLRANARTPPPRACTPFRSDESFDYFRKQKELSVELEKPLGAVLEEVEQGGVKVGEVVEGGSAQATGALKVGDRLTAVSGQDVSTLTLDTVQCAHCRF